MRRFFVASLAAFGVAFALACGNQIDTSIRSQTTEAGVMGPLDGTAPDGGAAADAPPGTSSDGIAPVDCTSVFEDTFSAGIDYDPIAAGWEKIGDVTGQQAAADLPNRLKIQGSGRPGGFIRRSIDAPSECGDTRIEVDFRVYLSTPFKFMTITTTSRMFVLGFETDTLPVSVGPIGGPPTSIVTLEPILAGPVHKLRAIIGRRGALWVTVDAMDAIDKARDIPVFGDEDAGTFDPVSLALGAYEGAEANAIDVLRVRISPAPVP